MKPVRVGILGCAKINGWGLMDHIDQLPEINVVNIASRSQDKAAATAAQYGIPRFSTYEELIRDPDVEVIYVPLPNSMHAEWSIAALREGKAVVCEKPLASNADEAASIQAAVEQSGLPLIEAVHYRYHPLAKYLVRMIKEEELGEIKHISMCIHLTTDFFEPTDVRFSYELAGGAAMDPGCYCVNVMRLITGEEPQVLEASPELINQDIDRTMVAKLLFPSGCIGELSTSLAKDPWEIRLIVEGTKGHIDTTNAIVPHFGHTWTQTIEGKTTELSFDMTPTFVYEWKEIAQVIREGAPIRTPASDGVATLKVVDEIYRKAGMRPR